MFGPLDPQTLIVRALVVLVMLGIAFPIHEFAHALAAYRLGDGTAKLMGRLTLDRWGEAIVSAAGPISNLVLAIAAALPLRYINATGMDAGLVGSFLSFFVTINLVLMVFNLIPIPPLDGSKVLFAFLNPRTVWQIRPVLEQYGFLILIAAMFLPIVGGQTIIGVVFNEVLFPLQRLLVGG